MLDVRGGAVASERERGTFKGMVTTPSNTHYFLYRRQGGGSYPGEPTGGLPVELSTWGIVTIW